MINNNDLFSRTRLAGYDPERLHAASVLVAGAGSLAQPLGENLVLSGVGDVRVADRDCFEPHNRAKSSHYPHHLSDADPALLPFKAEWVAGSLVRMATAPSAAIRWANTWVQDLGAGALADVDVIVSCVDAIAARRYLARRATELGVPLITGGFKAEQLWYAVYPATQPPHDGPCWNCGQAPDEDVFSCRHYANAAARQNIIPAIQTGAAALAGYMAEATIMSLHGQEPAARSVALNLRSGESLLSRPLADPQCAARHRRLGATERIDLHPARASLQDLATTLGLEQATVTLDAPFVHTAPCRTCERTTVVDAPLWAWVAEPRCGADGCGGPWPSAAGPERRVPPVVQGEIRLEDPLAERPMGDLGVAPADLVQVYAAGVDRVVEVGGDPLERFTSATA